MRLTSSFFALLATLTVAVEASSYVGGHQLAAKHARLARNAEPAPEVPRKMRKRSSCNASGTSAPASSSSSQPAPSTNPSAGNNFSGSKPAGGVVSGLIKVASSAACGASGAVEQVTATAGPNGSIDFLNCGINGAGWNPPYVTIDDIVTKELSSVAWTPNSAFTACQPYVGKFEQYGAQVGIPAIVLASFAMQESGCNPATVGGAGETGLMQLTSDKCGNAPGGNCADVDYNIQTGAQFFSQTLKDNGGDLLQSIGQYNGWYKGLTFNAATAAAHGGNCREQNNLDYLMQFLNGWVLDINAYSHNPPLGKYFNLNACPN